MQYPVESKIAVPFDITTVWLKKQDWRYLSVLQCLLDSQLLLGEKGQPAEALGQLFTTWWPTSSLSDVLADLCLAGLVVGDDAGVYAVPPEVQAHLVRELEDSLAAYPIPLPGERLPFAGLLEGFDGYCRQEASAEVVAGAAPTCGARAYVTRGRSQVLVLRPFPLRLCAHPEAYTALLCQLPPSALPAIAGHYAASPALRSRLALYDLAGGYKVNLTRSDVFVYFERYLRREHGMKVVPPAALTQALTDSGLLTLDKG